MSVGYGGPADGGQGLKILQWRLQDLAQVAPRHVRTCCAHWTRVTAFNAGMTAYRAAAGLPSKHVS